MLLSVGYPSLDHIAFTDPFSDSGHTRVVRGLWRQGTPGGCGANVALALARLGVPTAVSFALGGDPDSNSYETHLRAQGVSTALVDRRPNQAMPCAFFFIDPQGKTELYFDPAACRDWRGPEHIDLSPFAYLVLTVGAPQATRRFLEAAIRHHTPVVWQLKRDPQAFPEEELARYLACAKVVFANRDELAYVSQSVGANNERDLLEYGPEVLVVTAGGQGHSLITKHERHEVQAAPARVVDTTGAGDALTAGFLFGLVNDQPLLTCGRLGAVLASFVVEHKGCQAGLPTREQLGTRYRVVYNESPSLFEAHSHA